MTWTANPKTVRTTKIVSCKKVHPNVIGRAPSKTQLQFSPQLLYLAAARASHLHLSNPTICGPEFQMIARLIEPHVEEEGDDFAILPSAGSFKDFVGTYFTGTVAAGLAYLAMGNEGYVWGAHFEALSGGNTSTKKRPDFAFLGPFPGLALMESKGSAAGASALRKATRKGYRDQVEPQLGHTVWGIVATHGYCIGSWLRTGITSEMHIHHTAENTSSSDPGPAASVTPEMEAVIKREHFATVFTLVHSPSLGLALRSGSSEIEAPRFVRLYWRGRTWVTSLPEGDSFMALLSESDPIQFYPAFAWMGPFAAKFPFLFALEEGIAKSALESFFGDSQRAMERAGSIRPLLPPGLKAFDLGTLSEDGAPILPDGLALINADEAEFGEAVRWNEQIDRFESA